VTAAQQRFCPLCDQSFTEGEAILRCQGCGVMHHPACWVRNDGCATAERHEASPLAQAYTAGRPLMAADHHPAEGTRVIQSRGAPQPPPPPASDPREAVTVIDTPRAAPQRVAGPPPPAAAPVIGAADPSEPDAQGRRKAPAPYMVPGPGKGNRKATPVDPGDRRGLPRVYGGRGILGLWYIPAAVIVAIGVAAGVIYAAEAFFGDDDSEPATVTTPSPTGTGAASETATPSETAAAPSTATTAPGSATAATTPTGGIFNIGDTVVVKGSGDCLNVRKGAGRENEVLTCLPDGEELNVTGGPQVSGGITWWRLRTGAGDGWAAEEYLKKK